MSPTDIDLTEAGLVYAVSNTPLFLVRKLQNDQAVHALSERCSGEEIVDALRSAVAKEPDDPQEAVRPYAYLVALWYKPELDHLLQVASLRTPSYCWFAYIASALIQTFSPVQKQLIEIPGELSAPTVSTGSSVSTNVITIGG
jgi:hypothetical protein